jgi:putative zinc finger protein
MKHMANSNNTNWMNRLTAKRGELPCAHARKLLSPYFDGAVTGAEMQSIERHLQHCPACLAEYNSLRLTQQMLNSVRRVQPPADLGLKLRLAISHEAAATRRDRFEGLRLSMEDALQAFMVPATAGLACALLIFGLIIGVLATPSQLQANNQDVPTVLSTGPELQQSAFGSSLDSVNADSLVIEAYVDSTGRVQDYKILSDPDEAQQLLPQVKRMLIFTTFRPAMSMGHPISSKAVLSFSRVNVHG